MFEPIANQPAAPVKTTLEHANEKQTYMVTHNGNPVILEEDDITVVHNGLRVINNKTVDDYDEMSMRRNGQKVRPDWIDNQIEINK